MIEHRAEGHAAHVTMNRPDKGNTSVVVRELRDALQKAEGQVDVLTL